MRDVAGVSDPEGVAVASQERARPRFGIRRDGQPHTDRRGRARHEGDEPGDSGSARLHGSACRLRHAVDGR
jgi:hypothetical protein